MPAEMIFLSPTDFEWTERSDILWIQCDDGARRSALVACAAIALHTGKFEEADLRHIYERIRRLRPIVDLKSGPKPNLQEMLSEMGRLLKGIAAQERVKPTNIRWGDDFVPESEYRRRAHSWLQDNIVPHAPPGYRGSASSSASGAHAALGPSTPNLERNTGPW